MQFLVLRETGHFTKQRLISEQLMLWKTSKSRKLHQESLSHIFKQIRLSFDFELYPSLLVAAQTFTSHFFVVVRRRENYRLN